MASKKQARRRVIHVGVLHHKHGEDVFVGLNEREVRSKLYTYVREYWNDFANDGEKMPRGHEAAISRYFASDMAGDQEWVDIMTDTVRA